MMFRNIALKINLFLILSAFLYLFSVNSISIKKLGNKSKLDEFQERDILMKMAKNFIFIGESIDDKFRTCVDSKQATKSFFKAVEKKQIQSSLEGIGKECNNPLFVLKAQEDELTKTLNLIIDQTIIKYAAVESIVSTHRGTIPFDAKAINFEEPNKK